MMSSIATDNPRCEHLSEQLDKLELLLQLEMPEVPDKDELEGLYESVSRMLVDAMFDDDDETLQVAVPVLRRLARRFEDKQVEGFLRMVRNAQNVMVPRSQQDILRKKTMRREVLMHLKGRAGLTAKQVASGILGSESEYFALDVATHLSWLGERGLTRNRRAGEHLYWLITPKGEQALDESRP